MGIFRVRIGGQEGNFWYNTRMPDSIQCEEFYDERLDEYQAEYRAYLETESRDQETISK